MFDPWSATIEEVIELDKLNEDPEYMEHLLQHCAVISINASKKKVEAGDGLEIMSCVNWCLRCQLIAPVWLAEAFSKRYNPVELLLVKSWDDPKSFGKPFAKGSNISALRKKRNNQMAVWVDIQKLRMENPELPIDGNLFEEIGRKYGLGKTLASEYYYEVQKIRAK